MPACFLTFVFLSSLLFRFLVNMSFLKSYSFKPAYFPAPCLLKAVF